MAALTISHRLECITDTSINKIAQTLRCHRSMAVLPACRGMVAVQAGLGLPPTAMWLTPFRTTGRARRI